MGKLNNLVPRENRIMKPEEAAKLVELVEEPIKTKDVAVDNASWEEVCQRRMELDAAYTRTVSGDVMGEALKDDELVELLIKSIAVTRELGAKGDTNDTMHATFKNNALKIISYMGLYGDVGLTVSYNSKEVFETSCPGLSSSADKYIDSNFRKIFNNKKYVYQGNYYIKFIKKGDWIAKVDELYKRINPTRAKDFYGIEI